LLMERWQTIQLKRQQRFKYNSLIKWNWSSNITSTPVHVAIDDISKQFTIAWTPTSANNTLNIEVWCWTSRLHKFHFGASLNWKRTAKPLHTKEQHHKQLKLTMETYKANTIIKNMIQTLCS
jgi:hypothetical protein